MLKTALVSYRRFYAQDRAGQLFAFAASSATVPLHVVLALLFERVARPGGDAWTTGLLLITVAALILTLEIQMDVRGIGATLYRPMRRVQLGVFNRFLRLPPRRYPDVPSAAVSAATIQYIDGTFFLRDALRMTHGLLCALALGVVIARSSVWLGLISILPVLVMGMTLHLLRRQLVSIDTNERKARARLDTFLTDTLHGVLTVKLCGSEAASATHLARLSAEHQYRWFLLQIQNYSVPTLLNSFTYLVIPAFLAVGGYLIANETMTAAQLLSSYVILNIISYHTYQVNGTASYVLVDLRNMSHLTEFLAGDTDGEDTVEVVRGAVSYQDVRFSYDDRPGAVIDGVSLTIAPGEKVAIAGASGSGKSTLLALLLGMQHPQAGTVSVDGTPIGPHNAASLRRSIATVGQTAHLFDTDVTFNLTLGSEYSAGDIERALSIVGLDGFISALPEGMATRFGAGGFAISGGEKARLCLARALLMDRPILLLDEVTAQIDVAREREILANVLHDTPGTTVIAISHRLSSVRDFARIILLDGGRIADQGTHDELLSRCHRYRELFGRQIAG